MLLRLENCINKKEEVCYKPAVSTTTEDVSDGSLYCNITYAAVNLKKANTEQQQPSSASGRDTIYSTNSAVQPIVVSIPIPLLCCQ